MTIQIYKTTKKQTCISLHTVKIHSEQTACKPVCYFCWMHSPNREACTLQWRIYASEWVPQHYVLYEDLPACLLGFTLFL